MYHNKFVYIGLTIFVFVQLLPAGSSLHYVNHWHLHQPIYWNNKTRASTDDRKELASESIDYKNYDPWAGHPTSNVFAIFDVDDREAAYQYRPKDSLSTITSYPEAGFTISYSGALAENVRSLGNAYKMTYTPSWNLPIKEARSWTTSGGKTRMDVVLFTYHHSLPGLMDPEHLRKEIQLYKVLYPEIWGATPPMSRGFWPAECAFSERIIPVLLQEGISWSYIVNSHISRSFPEWPGTSYNTDPPNPADQINRFPEGYTPQWRAASIDGRPTTNELRYSYRPCYVRYIDPETGQEYKIIGIPMADYESYVDGYQTFPVDLFDAIAAAQEPGKPAFFALAHDGDNAWGGGYDSWMVNTPNKAAGASSKGYTPSQVEQYLADHPVDPNDILHVEDGPWVCPDGDFGSPMYIKWNWPWRYYDGVNPPTFDPNAWNEDAQFWAICTAGLNRILTLEERTSPPNMQNVLYPTNPGTRNLEKAWHYFLSGFDSGHIYYGGAEDFSMIPIIAQNKAMEYVDAELGEGELPDYAVDKTSPTIFYLSRFPYNPGGLNRGPAYGYRDWYYGPDFYVYTFVYDASGLEYVKLKYRVAVGTNTAPVIPDNYTYAGGPSVGPWQEIDMSSAVFQVKILVQNTDVTNTPPYNTFRPKYLPLRYWAKISAVNNKLYDYYVEAKDKKGNIRKSPIYHCYVGSTGAQQAGQVLWEPANPREDEEILIRCPDNKPGKLHWGVNNWTQPITDYWRLDITTTVAYGDGKSVESVMLSSPIISGATYYIKIGPFLNPSQKVTQVDFVFHYDDGTWNNNGGKDWHITVSSRDVTPPVQPSTPVLTSLNAAIGISWKPNPETDIKGYNIYWYSNGSTTSLRNIGGLVTWTTGFIDSGLTNGNTYTYVITAVDNAFNESGLSPPASAYPSAVDTFPPKTPTGFYATATKAYTIDLAWDRNLEVDVSSYKIYVATYSCTFAEKVSTATILHPATIYQHTGLTANITYYYQLTAVDLSNNESVPTEEVCAVVLDAPIPSAPQNFYAVASTGSVSLSWKSVTAPAGSTIVGYNVYRALYSTGPYTKIASLVPSTTHYDGGLTQWTSYYYYVTAVTNYNKESLPSTTYFAIPAPLVECVFRVNMSGQNPTVVKIAGDRIWPPWVPQTMTLEIGAIYKITLQLAQNNPLQYKYVQGDITYEQDFPAGPSNNRDVVISPNNADGKMYLSNIWNVDGDPVPNTVQNLRATGGSSGKIYLKWAANTDFDLDGYNIYFSSDGNVWTKTNSSLVKTSTYTITGLIDNVTYFCVVEAQDFASQKSLWPVPITAVAGLNTPPRTPTGLVVQSVNDSQVTLSWIPVQDVEQDADFVGYKIYWKLLPTENYTNSTGIIYAPPYTITGLTNNQTYYFVVRSVDIENLESANSNEVMAVPKPPLVFKERTIDGNFLDWEPSDVRYIDNVKDTYNFNDGYDYTRDIVAVYSCEGQDNYYFRVDLFELGLYAENSNLDIYIAIDCAAGGQMWLPDYTDCQTDTPWEVCIALYNSTAWNVYRHDWTTSNTSLKAVAYNSELDSVELALDKNILRSYGWTDGQPIRFQVFTTKDGTNGGAGEITNTSDLTDAIVDDDRGYSDGVLNGAVSSDATTGRAKYAAIYHGNQSINPANDIRGWIYSVINGVETGYKLGLDTIDRYQPYAKVNLHISGSLATALKWADESFVARISSFVAQGKAKLIGGVLAEHIMPYFENRGNGINVNAASIRYRKKVLQEIFGLQTMPRVFWTPERVIRGQTFADILTDADTGLPTGYTATCLDDKYHIMDWFYGGSLTNLGQNRFKLHKINNVLVFCINGVRADQEAAPAGQEDYGYYDPDGAKFWNHDNGLNIGTRRLLVELARDPDQEKLVLVFDDWEAYAGRSFTSNLPNDNAQNWDKTVRWIANHQWIEMVTLEDILDRNWTPIDHGVNTTLPIRTYDWLTHATENSYDNWYFGSSLEDSFSNAVPLLTGVRYQTGAVSIPNNKTYGYIGTPGTILHDVWVEIQSAPDNELKKLAEMTYNHMIFETAWHDEDNTDKFGPVDTTWDKISQWALKLHGHVRYAVALSSAAKWSQEVSQGQWTTTSVQTSDVDMDGENEYVIKNNKIFCVFENDGGRMVLGVAYDSTRGGIVLVGSPCNNKDYEGEEIATNSTREVSAFREKNNDAYENASYSAQLWSSSITFISPDGLIKKTIQLQDNSDTINAFYTETFTGPVYIRFGLTANYYDLLTSGRKNIIEINISTAVGVKNVNGGEVTINLGEAVLNTAYSDGTTDNTNAPLLKSYEIYGDGNFSFSLTLKGGTPQDTIPPAKITDLVAQTGFSDGTIDLSWTAPGDDGTVGNNVPPAKYVVKYATFPVVEGNITSWWNQATEFVQNWPVANQGVKEQKSITGLRQDTLYFICIRTVDDAGNISDYSNVVSAWTLPDLIPPSRITTLIAEQTENDLELKLSWIAPGDDGTVGTAQMYDIRYSTVVSLSPAISTTTFAAAASITDFGVSIPTPAVAGTLQTLIIPNLTGGVTYYFAIRAKDESSWSELSNGATNYPKYDSVPPATITDLTAQPGNAEGELVLIWTSPGDDGWSGNLVGKFEIRCSTSSSWSTYQCITLSTNTAPGVIQNYTLTGLVPGITYYVQLRSYDGANWSELSNIATSYAQLDVTPPATINDFTVNLSTQINSVILSWTVPGDDGYTGTATAYDIRYSTIELQSPASSLINFVSARSVTDFSPIPQPASPLQKQSMVVTGLISGVTYFFAIRTCDERYNWSGLSNGATIQFDITPPAAISNLTALTGINEGEVILKWTAPGDDETTGVVSSYLVKYATYQIISSLFDSAAVYYQSWTNFVPAGQEETRVVAGLTPGVTIYFAIKAKDDLNNYSVWNSSIDCPGINLSNYAVVKAIPPQAITDLTAQTGSSSGKIKLTWTATGDDGTTGNISGGKYYLKYSSDPSHSWDQMPYEIQWTTNVVQGTVQSYEVGNLLIDTTYYFYIKLADENLLWSELSNKTTGWTGQGPSTVTDLVAIPYENFGTIKLTWTAPNNVSTYHIRFTTYTPVTETTWAQATDVEGEPSPLPPGQVQVFIISGLTPGLTYWWGIKSQDSSGNWSYIDTIIPRPYARVRATWHNISTDGSLADWDTQTERLGFRLDKGFYCTWSSTAIYFAYSNNTFNDMDLFIMIDTHTDYNIAVGSRATPAWDNMESHILPFWADYALTVEGSAYRALRRWTGTTWEDLGNAYVASASVNDATAGGNSEFAVLLSALNYPTKIRILALHKWENARNIYNSFPIENPAPNTDTAVTFSHFYEIDLTSCAIPSESIVKSTNVATDTTPPAAITNLSALPGETLGTVKLTWTSPGDDGWSGVLPVGSKFRILYSTDSTLATYYIITISTSDVTPLSQQTYILANLSAGVTYFFRVWTIDDAGLISEISNSATTYAQIYSRPARITTLAGSPGDYQGEIKLTWIAPDANEQTQDLETATEYDIRLSTTASLSPALNLEKFLQAEPVTNYSPIPQPLSPGSTQSMIITGLIQGAQYYFAIRSRNGGNWSDISNGATTYAKLDDIPPAKITDLIAEPGTIIQSIRITWTSPGDDGTLNNITNGKFEIRYSTDETLSIYQLVTITTNTIVGTIQTYTLTGLLSGVTYYFRLRTGDEETSYKPINWSELSNTATSWAQIDNIPPGKITTLVASPGTAAGTITLSWISVGDDDISGQAVLYDIRLSSVADDSPAISDTKFNSAMSVSLFSPIPAPLPAGTWQSMTITGLSFGTTYYFAIKVKDDVGLWSELSTGATSWAQQGVEPITDLVAKPGPDFGKITLTWTAPKGNPSGYVIRYRTDTELTESNWSTATDVDGEPPPGPAGQVQIYKISGLTPGVTYYWAIKSQCSDGTLSAIDTTSPRPYARCGATYHNISVDGTMSDWHTTERLGIRNQKEFYVTWSSTAIYIGYTGTNIGDTDPSTVDDADFFVFFDTHTDYTDTRGTKTPPAWDGIETHTLPFNADYALCIEAATYKSVRKWTGSSWYDPGDGGGVAQSYIGWSGNTNTEVAIPFSSLDNPSKLRLIAFHKWENARNIYNSFPTENSAPNTDTAVSFGYFYEIYLTSGAIPQEAVVYSTYTALGDFIPPAAITDLKAEVGENFGEIILTWTAPSEDGNSGGAVSSYEIRYTTYIEVTDSNWQTATQIVNVPPPASPGTVQSMTVVLTPGVTYYFGIKSIDDAGNVSPIDSTSPRAYARARTTFHNITCDGSISDWHLQTERLGLRNDKGFWCTWSSTAVYFCYSNNSFADMDLFILIDTHVTYGVEIGSRSPPAWDNMESHTLPFYADYALTIEGPTYKALRYWDGTTWVDPGDNGGIATSFISTTADGNTEIAILRSALNNPTKIRVVALHKGEDARNIYNSFPIENPAPNTDIAVNLTCYYLIDLSSTQVPSESFVLVGEDTTPPSAITTLHALPGPYQGEVTLTWASPGDDGYNGDIVCGKYWIKYSSIGEINDWSNPPQPCYEIVIATNTSPGSLQTFIVTGLTGKTTWYFAIKTADENNNWSEISNSTSCIEGYYNLSVTKHVYEVTNSTRPGGVITYEIKLNNYSNIKLFNVNLKDKIPDYCIYSTGTITLDSNTVSDNEGFNPENNSIDLNISQIDINEEKTVRFKVKIK